MRLTPDEIKLVVFVLMALLIGAAVKHWRTSQRMEAARTQAVAPANGTEGGE